MSKYLEMICLARMSKMITYWWRERPHLLRSFFSILFEIPTSKAGILILIFRSLMPKEDSALATSSLSAFDAI